MENTFLKNRKSIIIAFTLISVLSLLLLPRLKFGFSFEQFFPDGDEDLEFFQDFISEFESDDNFLLIAVERKDGVFDSIFLESVHQFSLDCRSLPHVTESRCLTQMKNPVKAPFGVTTVPVIHRKTPALYDSDKEQILNDPRFANTLIDKNGTSLVVSLKTEDLIGLPESKSLMEELNALIEDYGFEDHYILGRAYFQQELVEMKLWEMIISTLISGVLVSIMMFLIFRKMKTVFLGLISIGIGFVVFMGILSLMGRELNAMAALYPVLMVIVGTSDVVHILSKYLDEIKKGNTKDNAIIVTIKEIGLATLFTSLTTAVGFLTLLTSKIGPIRDLGMNGALGVMVAYVTVVLFTTSVISFYSKDDLMSSIEKNKRWDLILDHWYRYTLNKPRQIVFFFIAFCLFCFYGMSKVSTNYKIEKNLPKRTQITKAYNFFEENYSGFRPMEFAVYAKGGKNVGDYVVLKEIDKLEQYLNSTGSVGSIASVTALHKSIHKMLNGNKMDDYRFPQNEKDFQKQEKYLLKVPKDFQGVFVSKDQKKARVSTRVLDVGADVISTMGKDIDQWIASNLNTEIVDIKRTGTGIIVDKNAIYVRENLIQGLGLALLIVSLLMGFLYRSPVMVLISLVPNIVPLFFAAALLGYLNFELDAGISIVFALIFGIAVDDSIHFLSKYKLSLSKYNNQEEAMKITFRETGKAIIFTTIILFFGFLVLMFSNSPPSIIVGLLISITLISAVICDLTLLPVLIRKFGKRPLK